MGPWIYPRTPNLSIMKLQVKQLDCTTANTIAVALEMYAASVSGIDKSCSDKYLTLAVEFRHSIPLLVSERYSEKGGVQ